MSEEIHFLEDGYYVEKLEKDIEKLKEELKYTISIVEHNKIVSEKNKENKQLKEVINELNEALKHIDDDIMKSCENYDVNGIELKKILNKIKEN